MKNTIIKSTKYIALAIIVTFGTNTVLAWTGPTALPPGANAAAPINVGSSLQYKAGGLSLGTNITPLTGYDLFVPSNLSFFKGIVVDAGGIYSSGRIGISTSDPQGKLDIYNDTNTAASLPLLSIRSDFHTAGNYGMIRFGDYTQTSRFQKGAIIYESTGNSAKGKFHIALDDSDTESSVSISDTKLTVLSDGKVGIGTTAPISKLEVVGGSIKATGGLIIQTCNVNSCPGDSGQPSLVDGQIWLVK